MKPELNPYIIPAEILEAATKVSLFFKKHNSRGWQLLDICDRIYAERGLEITDIKFGELTSGDRFYAYGSLWTCIGPETARKHGYIGDGICSFDNDVSVKFIPPSQLACSSCGNNRQVWVNQITKKLTCHRLGCNNQELE